MGMSWDNKVVWSEGMFLQPQHFQQQDRYFEHLVRERVAALRPYGWGITELRINHELLGVGKFAISQCRGIFEDGTPFNVPLDMDHPAPLDLHEDTRDCTVYMTLPVRHPGGAEVSVSENAESVARIRGHEYEVSDTTEGADSAVTLHVGKLRLRLALETEPREGYLGLGLARIVEVRSDKQVVLHENYIPPCLVCGASPILGGFISELHGLIHHRGEAMAGRVSESGTGGVAEIADFLLLQIINRFEPLMAHLGAIDGIHPERFYATALEIAGELATFTAAGKRPVEFPVYRHEDLEHTFAPLIADLRQSLSAVIETIAVAIPLQERKYGIRVAVISDRSLLGTASFVLAVKAGTSPEALRRHFPNQIKIGPVETIRELVNSALPGIGVRPLPVAPRQIPYHTGVTYFELDRSGRMWKQLQKSGGIAMHLAGDLPDLELEFWAIRSR
jgi:type VI secretion system protein ImpJ